ncbi:hypothetical protein [Hansschlegelia sp.]|uniref:hypothetical protein n=1 Tax=Hansschlegelia sp. TaxID=2041892 RepID=UPI002C1801BC|nr:hypothetical protein [Hansschlegelia sp.]HVI28480.1 hypothetical protein [Hansschlegelia sp.]
MSYTVISQAEPSPVATVVPTVIEALSLARELAKQAEDRITIATDSGWMLSLDELEELVKN